MPLASFATKPETCCGVCSYRFTAWVPMDNSTARVDWGAEVLYELYDLQGDTGSDFDFDGCVAHMTSISWPSVSWPLVRPD